MNSPGTVNIFDEGNGTFSVACFEDDIEREYRVLASRSNVSPVENAWLVASKMATRFNAHVDTEIVDLDFTHKK